jgi:hypothetical protein
MTPLLVATSLYDTMDYVWWFGFVYVLVHFVCLMCGHCALQLLATRWSVWVQMKNTFVINSYFHCNNNSRLWRRTNWQVKTTNDVVYQHICMLINWDNTLSANFPGNSDKISYYCSIATRSCHPKRYFRASGWQSVNTNNLGGARQGSNRSSNEVFYSNQLWARTY